MCASKNLPAITYLNLMIQDNDSTLGNKRMWCLDMYIYIYIINLGWGLLSRFSPLGYFPNFSTAPNYMLAIEYHVHIWQVLQQLGCGGTYQISMWLKECNRYFARSKILLTEKLTNGALVTPTPDAHLPCAYDAICHLIETLSYWNHTYPHIMFIVQ